MRRSSVFKTIIAVGVVLLFCISSGATVQRVTDMETLQNGSDPNLSAGHQSPVDSWVDNHTYEPSNTSPSQTGNMALYFDGSDDVVVPDDPSLDPTDAITVMAWIKADDWNGNRRILQKGVDDQYRLIDEGPLKFNLAGVTGGDIQTSLPSTGTWHHVAGTYDGSTIKLYVDGTKRASGIASGHIQTSSTELYIGNKPLSSYSGDHFKGTIDEVRIYNRALTGTEINETRTNSAPSSDGLVLYFSFDNMDGNTCPDSSSFGNDGTNHGAEWVTSFEWQSPSPVDQPPSTPMLESYYLTSPNGTATIRWQKCSDPDGSIEEYQVQMGNNRLFSSPTSAEIENTVYTASGLSDGSHFFRIRARDNMSVYGDWSQIAEVVVYTGFPIIVHHSDVTILETATDASVVWQIESEYPFSYRVYRNETMVQSADGWTGNVSVNIANEPIGVYSYSLVITDMIGRNWTDSILVTVEPDTGSAILAAASFGGVGAGILACSVVAFVLVSKRRKKRAVETAIDRGEMMKVSSVAEEIGKPESMAIGLIEECDNAFLSKDQTSVIPISYIQRVVQDEFDRTGCVDLVQVANDLGVSSSQMKTVQLTNCHNSIRTENMLLFRRDVAIEKVRGLFLSSNGPIMMQQVRDAMPVDQRTLNNLVASSNLTLLSRPDGSMYSIDSIIETMIEKTKEAGILSLREFISSTGLPIEEFTKAIGNKRFDDIYFLSSADLILSHEWIASFRNGLRANREAAIVRLENNPSLNEQQVDKILGRFDPGDVDIVERSPITQDASAIRGIDHADFSFRTRPEPMTSRYGLTREPLPSRRTATKSSGEMGMCLLFAGIIMLMLGLMSWGVYIPVFSESFLGEIGGSILICIGLGKMKQD